MKEMFERDYDALRLQKRINALGSDGGTYELIETITVGAGGAASIVRDAEPDTTPYNFKAMFLYCDMAATVANMACDIAFGSGEMPTPTAIGSGSVNDISTDQEHTYCHIYCVLEHGIWRLRNTVPTYDRYIGTAICENNVGIVTEADAPNCTLFQLDAESSFPEGSVIKVYAIRAST